MATRAENIYIYIYLDTDLFSLLEIPDIQQFRANDIGEETAIRQPFYSVAQFEKCVLECSAFSGNGASTGGN